jgi:hypothetical protein
MISIFPIASYWRRRKATREIQRIDELCRALRRSLQKGGSSAVLRSSRLRHSELSKEIARTLGVCSELSRQNRAGSLVEPQKARDRFNALKAKIEELDRDEQLAREFLSSADARVRRCLEQASALHPSFQSGMRHRANQFRKQFDAIRDARSFGDVSRLRGQAETQLRLIESEVERALEVERSRDEALRLEEEAEKFGPPMTTLWHEHCETLARDARSFREYAPNGDYAAAHRALESCRTLIHKISEDRDYEFQLAKESIQSWIAILDADPESRVVLERLYRREFSRDFLSEWQTEQEKLHKQASIRYANTLRLDQDHIRRTMNLRYPPIRKIEVTADPASPVLRWDELLKFARIVQQQLARAGQEDSP